MKYFKLLGCSLSDEEDGVSSGPHLGTPLLKSRVSSRDVEQPLGDLSNIGLNITTKTN